MTQGKGKFWQGTRGQWLPACPLRQGASVAPSQPALTTCLQHSSCKCGACTRSSSAKKIFLKLLELLLAAGAFLPSGQLCKTLKEQRLNLVRANQLCRSPKIAYLRDLKKIPKQTKKHSQKPPTPPPPPAHHISPPSKLKKPFYTPCPRSTRMATSSIQQSWLTHRLLLALSASP